MLGHRLRLVGSRQGHGKANMAEPDKLDSAACPRALGRVFKAFDIDTAMRHRNIDCSYYDRCLQVCVARRWNNFTCRWCSRFQKTESTEGLSLV